MQLTVCEYISANQIIETFGWFSSVLRPRVTLGVGVQMSQLSKGVTTTRNNKSKSVEGCCKDKRILESREQQDIAVMLTASTPPARHRHSRRHVAVRTIHARCTRAVQHSRKALSYAGHITSRPPHQTRSHSVVITAPAVQLWTRSLTLTM